MGLCVLVLKTALDADCMGVKPPLKLKTLRHILGLYTYWNSLKDFLLLFTFLKERKLQSKCMFRVVDDDIESPYFWGESLCEPKL